jgi:hypothetical protein
MPSGTPELSEMPADKLQALVSREMAKAVGDLDYVESCRAWFSTLPPRERTTANAALAALRRGDERSAMAFACALPAAPGAPTQWAGRPLLNSDSR